MKDKRLRIVNTILTILFVLSLVLEVINKIVFTNAIPEDIIKSVSCLFIGGFLGFRLALNEIKRIYNNQFKK